MDIRKYLKTITYRQSHLSIFFQKNGQGRQDLNIDRGRAVVPGKPRLWSKSRPCWPFQIYLAPGAWKREFWHQPGGAADPQCKILS